MIYITVHEGASYLLLKVITVSFLIVYYIKVRTCCNFHVML